MKKLISLVLALALCTSLAVPAMAAEFSDVPADHAFYNAIMDCAGKGIVGGYEDGTFRPANSVTKTQFCVMLSRAFYADEIAKYANPEGSKLAWFAPNAKALYYAKVLPNTSFEYQYINKTVMDQNINRYDMAQLMANIMDAKGFAASESGKDAAAAKIADYADIPDQYRDAVTNVYALGIIGGFSDGTFGGEVTMNRGQAAVVIYRLAQYVGDGSGTGSETSVNDDLTDRSEDPAGPGSSETTPETPKPTTVAVTSAPYNGSVSGTEWTITDNKQPEGYLANGKPITQENVLSMLADAKKIWPDGMTWTTSERAPTGNNYYALGMASSVGSKCVLRHNTSSWMACGAFAAMLSDYVFGPSSNPVRKLSDNTQVRPGDIVFRLSPDGSVAHVNIAVTTVVYDGSMPCAYTANGNSGGTVDWRSAATSGKSGSDRIDDYERTPGQWCRCVIYTRYPD